MATITIKLNKSEQPYYVDCFGTPARCEDTIKWETVDGEFSVAIRGASDFFTDANPVEKFTISSSGTNTKQFNIKSDLEIETMRIYEVYCVDNKDFGDAPPRIIIVA